MRSAARGPFLGAYIENQPRFARVRYWLGTLFIVGVFGAIATALAPLWSGFDLVHDLLLLAMIFGMTAGLTIAVRSGSRFAQYQAVGYAPLIILGLLVLSYELSTGAPVPYWPVAALLAVLVDFIVTSGGVINGYITVKRERDAAWADVSEARIAVATDPLTEIANRRGLALRFRDPAFGRPTALAVIDCDNFKRINDMFGHDTGDEVLIAVAEGLKQENVFPARQGGEEFVVLIYGEDYQRLAETVRRQITLSVLEKVPEVPFRNRECGAYRSAAERHARQRGQARGRGAVRRQGCGPGRAADVAGRPAPATPHSSRRLIRSGLASSAI